MMWGRNLQITSIPGEENSPMFLNQEQNIIPHFDSRGRKSSHICIPGTENQPIFLFTMTGLKKRQSLVVGWVALTKYSL